MLQMQGVEASTIDPLQTSTESERRLNMSAMHRILDRSRTEEHEDGELSDQDDPAHDPSPLERVPTLMPSPARVPTSTPWTLTPLPGTNRVILSWPSQTLGHTRQTKC